VRASLPERLLKLSRKNLAGRNLENAIKGQRAAYSGIVGDFLPYTVYDRYLLPSDVEFRGPAIIEERESTVIVGEDATASVDEFGFIWIDLKEE
jgi:N-methylhydantoinase A